jgi:hypothetical protein
VIVVECARAIFSNRSLIECHMGVNVPTCWTLDNCACKRDKFLQYVVSYCELKYQKTFKVKSSSFFDYTFH